MKRQFTSVFERWSSGSRGALDYLYGIAAYPASLLYRVGAAIRPPLSKRFPALQHSRLLVVSSPLVGGVGKTPLTALLSNQLKVRKERFAIVTLGYGRQSRSDVTIAYDSYGPEIISQCGDEALELQRLTGARVQVGDKPEHIIDSLDQSGEFDWILFDDGISRTWESENRIAVIAASDLMRPVRYLPFGRWRTSPKYLRAAQYVAVTGSPNVLDGVSVARALSRMGYRGSQGLFAYRTEGLASLLPSGIVTMMRPPEGRPLAFCGISRPERFLADAAAFGAAHGAFRAFPDHHPYSHSDFMELERERTKQDSGWYLSTLKDAVKIDPAWLGSTPLCFLRIALHQVAGPDIVTVLAKDI